MNNCTGFTFQVLKQNLGIGGVISLLWFQRRLPVYACKFIEMCLMVTADHGPAVSGAHNTVSKRNFRFLVLFIMNQFRTHYQNIN